MERDLGVAESGRVSFEEFKGRLRKQLEFIPLPVEMKKLGPSLKQNVSPPRTRLRRRSLTRWQVVLNLGTVELNPSPAPSSPSGSVLSSPKSSSVSSSPAVASSQPSFAVVTLSSSVNSTSSTSSTGTASEASVASTSSAASLCPSGSAGSVPSEPQSAPLPKGQRFVSMLFFFLN